MWYVEINTTNTKIKSKIYKTVVTLILTYAARYDLLTHGDEELRRITDKEME